MNLIVYSDPGCQTKAYEITSPICTNATEVAVFCSNSIATVLNCNPNNWRLVQLNETELSVTVQSSKNCVPFAYAIENYNFRIYFNQECQADGWSEPHLGNMSTIDVGIPIIPTPQTSTTDSTGLYLIIGNIFIKH